VTLMYMRQCMYIIHPLCIDICMLELAVSGFLSPEFRSLHMRYNAILNNTVSSNTIFNSAILNHTIFT